MTVPQTVYLVRHAMPVVDASLTPRQWRLDGEAMAAASRLRDRLPPVIRLVASSETKAQQTGEAIAASRVPVAADAGFDEVDRPADFDPRYRETAAAYLDGSPKPGWEPRGDVVARFGAAVARHRGGDGALVVVTHGLAMSLWAAHIHKRQQIADWWARLAFPDVVAVRLP